MKQKRIKPRPTPPKGKRRPFKYEECLDDCDWIHDCNQREYKKSQKYKDAKTLADKFAKRKS